MNPHPLAPSTDWPALETRMAQSACVCVRVARHQGSVPREHGAWMLVFENGIEGTVGGGHLELQAIAQARALLDAPAHKPITKRFALGPSLGQCCGGVVWLDFEHWHATIFVAQNDDSTRTEGQNRIKLLQRMGFRLPTLALFGGGHVGRAIVQVASLLPMPIAWIDSRDEIFPELLPANVRCEHSAPVQAAVFDAKLIPSGSRLLVMSFSHAEDLDICHAALDRQRSEGDLSFIGLIGSKTKWASFKKRLTERGFSESEIAQITCPIGVDGVVGKEPGVIAVAVAAQLLALPTMPLMQEGVHDVLA